MDFEELENATERLKKGEKITVLRWPDSQKCQECDFGVFVQSTPESYFGESAYACTWTEECGD